MALVTRSEFDALLASLVEDNTTGSITPADLRSMFDALMDSVIWYNETPIIGGGGGGDVVGPASAVDGRAALFDSTTGKLLKQATGAPVLGPGTVTSGHGVVFTGTTGNAIASTGAVPMAGPSSSTDGYAALFDSTTGKLLKVATGAPVIGPGTVTSGRAVLFSGTSGIAISQAAGAPVLGPGAVTSGHAVLFSGTTGDLLSSAGAAPVLNTAAGLRGAFATASVDGTQGPLLGADIKAALLSMTTADVLDFFSDLSVDGGFHMLVASTAPASGGIVVAGAALATNIYGTTAVESATIDADPDSWPYAGTDGLFVSKTPLEAYLINEADSPYSVAAQTATLVSNVVNFSAASGASRNIKLPSAITANATLNITAWDSLDQGQEVLLRITTGATGRTFQSATPLPADGLVHLYDTTVICTASSYTYFRLFYFDNVPHIQRLGETLISGAGASVPTFIGQAFAASDGVTPFAHQANDMLVAFAYRPNSSVQPTLPAGWTDIGVGGDANSPSLRGGTKVATTAAETCTGWTNATQVHCITVRKAGSVPTVGTASYDKTTTTADTSIDWDGVTVTNGIVLGIHCLLTDDTGTLRTGLNAGTTGSQGASQSRTYTGYSDLVSAWAPATTTKTGTAGRAITCEVPIT